MSYAIIIGKNNEELGGLYYSDYFIMDIKVLLDEVDEILNAYNSCSSIRNEDFYKSMILMFNTYKNLSFLGYSILEYEPFIDNYSEDFLLKRFPKETFSFNRSDYRTISFNKDTINHFKSFCNGYVYIDLEKASIRFNLFKKVSKEKFKEWREEKGIKGIPATLMGYGASNPGKIFDIAINNFSDTRKVLEMLQEGYTVREEWYIPKINL